MKVLRDAQFDASAHSKALHEKGTGLRNHSRDGQIAPVMRAPVTLFDVGFLQYSPPCIGRECCRKAVPRLSQL